MENKKKFIILMVIGAVFILIGGRVLLFQTLLGNNDTTLEADINGAQQEDQETSIKQQIIDQNNIEKESTSTSNQQDNEEEPIPDEPKPIVSIEENIDETQQQEFSPITIIAPPFIGETILQSLRKEVFEKTTVIADIQVPKTRQQYKQLLEKEQQSPTADIIMIPTDRRYSFQERGVHIPLRKPIAPLFHPIFEPLINNEKATYIPYALDPYITMHQEYVNFNTHDLSRARIQNTLLSLSLPQNVLPVTFGITDKDIILLEQTRQVYPGYIPLLLRIIDQAKVMRNSYIIEFFLEDTLQRSPLTFLRNIKQLQDETPWCTSFPLVCHMVYEKSAVGFAKLSDMDQAYTSFPKETKEKNSLRFTHFPVDESYPVTGRGFVINKSSPHLDESGVWIQGYIQTGLEHTSILRNHILSAFNERLQKQKRETIYAPFNRVRSSFMLTQGSLEDETYYIEHTALLPMLKGDYSKTIYLRELLDT